MSILHNIIPAQKHGSHVAATSTCNTESRHAALVLFNEAKTRLLDINNWSELCHGSVAEFRITDKYGFLLQTNSPQVGDLIRMRLPLTQHATEITYSWARIENFESSKDLLKDEQLFGFCIKAIEGPLLPGSENDTHSYINNAVNYFMIYRKACTLVAIEQEKDESQKKVLLADRLRHMISELMAVMKLSKSRWKRLVNGILKPSLT